MIEFQPREPRRPIDSNAKREQSRQRQTLTIVFAIILVWIASVSSAQSPQPECVYYSEAVPNSQPLQYDGMTAVADGGGAVPLHRLTRDARPAYVQLAASLSNFDADSDPDGWRADLVLRDREDRPVVMRAHATFELMPRVSIVHRRRTFDAGNTPIRWSMRLEYDEDGVARVKLPLRNSMHTMLGWSSVSDPRSGIRSRNDNYVYPNRYQSNRSTSRDLRELIVTPEFGELRVRVSVATEGVFEAATPVRIRPSVLVDTRWPYR